ncbi:PIG-L deacetylase family protein [Streptomyces microflavus]|uniref:PIG-L deacetylase family protein n=1 Tax=Streptomyces microflavus TaxID=1919 RepID=UPI0037F22F89
MIKAPTTGSVQAALGTVGPGTTVLAVHAHPDDETWANGAALSMLSDRGCTVLLRVASGGEASEPGYGEDTARARRAQRLTKVCRALGIRHWSWLQEGRWIDTAGRPSPRSLTNARVEELATQVALHMEHIAPDIVLTVGADGLTGHPDHILIHQAARSAVRQTGLPVRMFGAHLLEDDVARGHELLKPLLGGRTAGSGRCTGSAPDALIHTLTATPRAAQARRTALDHYKIGLGTKSLAELVATSSGPGDSLLLRAVYDAIGWGTERYCAYD